MDGKIMDIKGSIRREVRTLPKGRGLNERERNQLYNMGKQLLAPLFPDCPELVARAVADWYGI